MDFTSLIAAVDASTITAAIASIAAVLILPRVAKWGFRQVMSMVR